MCAEICSNTSPRKCSEPISSSSRAPSNGAPSEHCFQPARWIVCVHRGLHNRLRVLQQLFRLRKLRVHPLGPEGADGTSQETHSPPFGCDLLRGQYVEAMRIRGARTMERLDTNQGHAASLPGKWECHPEPRQLRVFHRSTSHFVQIPTVLLIWRSRIRRQPAMMPPASSGSSRQDPRRVQSRRLCPPQRSRPGG